MSTDVSLSQLCSEPARTVRTAVSLIQQQTLRPVSTSSLAHMVVSQRIETIRCSVVPVIQEWEQFNRSEGGIKISAEKCQMTDRKSVV